jgi:MFS family permease
MDEYNLVKIQTKCKKGWLNRNVIGMGIASLFSDLSHETATAVLPMFLVSIGSSAAALGTIEGFADAISSFAKLGAGWYSDKTTRRKPIAVAGYFLTGIAKGAYAMATSSYHILIARSVGWFGRGIRSPVRDAMLADSVEPLTYGRAFGFHRAADTLGAVMGPLVAFLLAGTMGYRQVFLVTLIPGLLAVAAFAILVKERPRLPNHHLRLWKTINTLPKGYKMYLIGVGIFGLGDFAHTLLILRASSVLTTAHGALEAGRLALLLYVFHNVLYALMSYPVGALSDKIGKRGLLAIGYLVSAVMCIGFILAIPKFWYLAVLFALGGVYIAAQDALEGAIAAELLPEDTRGTGYGVLATINGLGDFLSSIVVGFLWTAVAPWAGFTYSAILSVIGGVAIFHLR